MNVDLLDAEPFLPALEQLALAAASQAGDILDRAGALAERIRAEASLPDPLSARTSTPGGFAFRTVSEPHTEEIAAGLADDGTGETALTASWERGQLESLTFVSGGRCWWLRQTPDGQARTGPGDEVQLEALVAELTQTLTDRVWDEQRDWLDRHLAVGGWACESCQWPNAPQAVRCELCGLPTVLARQPQVGVLPPSLLEELGATPLESLGRADIAEALRTRLHVSEPPEALAEAPTDAAREAVEQLLDQVLQDAAEPATRPTPGPAEQTRHCPACRQEIRAEANFCDGCGTPTPPHRPTSPDAVDRPGPQAAT